MPVRCVLWSRSGSHRGVRFIRGGRGNVRSVLIHGHSFGGALQSSVASDVRALGVGWKGKDGGFGGVYAQVSDCVERDCVRSEALGGCHKTGIGGGLTFNTAANGRNRFGHGRLLKRTNGSE
jgi:hypothetical protein